MPDGIRAFCFPRDDHDFAVQVERLVRESPEEPFEAAVEAMLRGTYPLAVIAPRQAMAAVDGQRVWYVYRDGAYATHDDGGTPADGGSS